MPADTLGGTSRRDVLRWGLCLAVMVAAHAGAAVAVLDAPAPADDGFMAGAAVQMIDLSETPAAMPVPQRNLAPGPEQAASRATPAVKEETKPPEETAELTLPEPEPPKPEPPAEEKQATAPPPVIAVPQQSATTAGIEQPQPPSPAVLRWQSTLQAQIAQAKRYPLQAAARREQGYVRITFTVDRNGRVVEVHVIQASGFPLLNDEFLAMVARAQPHFPKPPPDAKDSDLTFSIGTRFTLN